MTLSFYKDYIELFNGCLWYSDGSFDSNDSLLNYMNALQCTKTGTPTRTAIDRFGTPNKAVNNFTNSSYFTLPKSIFTNNSILTFCFWVKFPSSAPTAYPSILGTNVSPEGGGIFLFFHNSGYLSFYDYRTNPSTYKETVITWTGNWHFIVAQTNRNSGSDVKTYIDSEYKGSGNSFAAGGGSTYAQLLGNSTRYNRPLSTALGEFMIFNKILSISEISALWNLTKSKYLYPVQSGNRAVE